MSVMIIQAGMAAGKRMRRRGGKAKEKLDDLSSPESDEVIPVKEEEPKLPQLPSGYSQREFNLSQSYNLLEGYLVSENDDETEAEKKMCTEERIRSFFSLTPSEQLLGAYPCTLLQEESISQGAVYLTEKHICFFADVGLDSVPGYEGYIGVGRRAQRLWSSVQGGQLKIFADRKSYPFFPKKTVNLQDVKEIKELNERVFKVFYFDPSQKVKKVTFTTDTTVSRDRWIRTIRTLSSASKAKQAYIRVVLPLDQISSMESVHGESIVDTLCVTHQTGNEFLFSGIRDLQEIEKIFLSSWKDAVEEAKQRIPEKKQKRERKYSEDSIIIRPPGVKPHSQACEGKDKKEQAEDEACVDLTNLNNTAQAVVSSTFEKINMVRNNSGDIKDEKSKAKDKNYYLQKKFDLPPEEIKLKSYHCALERSIKVHGRVYMTPNYLCFRSKIAGAPVAIVPFLSIRNFSIERRRFHDIILLDCEGDREVVFSRFRNIKAAYNIFTEQWEKVTNFKRQSMEFQSIQEHAGLVNIQKDLLKGKMILPAKPLKITIMTIGSRGDIQPFVALALGLEKAGHKVRLASHEPFREFVTSYGLEFAVLGGDPKELMELCVNNGMFTPKFIKEATEKFRGFVDILLRDAWAACQGAEAIIQAPSVMAGYHIAEKLKVPFFTAFTMPFTRTGAFPHPFLPLEKGKGKTFNYMSYLTVEQLFWQPLRGQINAYRKDVLGIPTIGLGQGGHRLLHDNQVPFIYCFSSHVVPKPYDWGDWIDVSGYWFLDNASFSSTPWNPPADLVDFIKAGTPPVYIGFGSIVVEDPDELTNRIVEAIKKSGQRVILAKGWGGVGEKAEIPKDRVYLLSACPHDWLFPQMSAVCHHGGAGTTAAGLRAGKPTIIVSFFGDQFFWGDRVTDLGVGCTMRFNQLNTDKFAAALKTVATDSTMASKAKALAEKINSEDGVQNSINFFHAYLPYAVIGGTHDKSSSA